MAENKMNVRLTDLKSLGEREFSGYGSIFRNKDLGNDVVEPGAFTKSLAEHESEGTLPIMLWQHDPTRVPGKWVEMREDSRGLFVRGKFAPTPLGSEAYELIKMKALAGLSIGYGTVRSDYDSSGVRRLKELALYEVSIVSMPMNPRAQVEAAKDQIKTIRAWENTLHGLGFSTRAATRLASKTWEAIARETGGSVTTLDDISADLDEQRAIARLLASASKIRSMA